MRKKRFPPGEIDVDREEDEFADDSLGSKKWKWILFGSAGFVFVFLMSIFFATIYVHKKEMKLGLHKSQEKILEPVVQKQEKKHIVKRYDLSPFFLRLKDAKPGEDRFLSAKVYIEFVSSELPAEIKAKKELLRTLVYRQLKRHFEDVGSSQNTKDEFKKNLVSALNIFFKGGGVYDVGFKELVIR